MPASPAFWRDRRVLVTGGAGFLGSRLSRALVERGADVVVLVRDDVPRSELRRSGTAERVTRVHGRVEDSDLVERTVNEYEVETVFHLAAQTIVPIANRDPRGTFESNVRGTWTVLEACRRVPGVGRVVVASSDKAYGDRGAEAYDEDAPLRGRHPYDVSKSCADLISLAYHATYRLPVAVTRCGNLYGGGDLNWNRIVPGTIRSALRGERPVVRSDGRLVRDYFYVDDAVAAYLLVAERMDDAALHGEAFNFSNERPSTVLEVVRAVLDRTDASLEPRVLGENHGEIRDQHLSARKARERLGWRPTWTLETGLDETVAWYRRFFADEG